MRDTSRLPLVSAIGGLALPAVLSFLLPNFYHVNDAWFLGKAAGPDATNAMGLFQIVSIANFGFILTLARGTQSLVGRRFGAGNLPGCQLAIAQGMRLAVLVLVVLGTVEWLLVPSILEAMGGEGATIDEGVAYVRTLLLFLPFLFASPLFEFSFQGMGDTKTPFKLQALAVLVNTGLNWVLVLPHQIGLTAVDGGTLLTFDSWDLGAFWPGGLVQEGPVSFGGLGAMGAAAATGISRMVAAVTGFTLLVRRHRLQLLSTPSSYRADGPLAREILRVGLPAGSSTFLYALVAAVITKIISRFGQDALGAYAIGFRGIESVSFMVVLGFGVATGTVAAHAVGAGDFIRARRAGHVGAAMASAVMLATTILFLSIPESLAGVFTDDASIQAIAAGYIAVMAWCQLPQALEMVYGDAMAGAGSSTLAAALSIPGNLIRIPLAFWLADGLGLEGVWYAIVASAVLKGLGMVALFASGAWERAMHAGRHMLETER